MWRVSAWLSEGARAACVCWLRRMESRKEVQAEDWFGNEEGHRHDVFRDFSLLRINKGSSYHTSEV